MNAMMSSSGIVGVELGALARRIYRRLRFTSRIGAHGIYQKNSSQCRLRDPVPTAQPN
jgi:hypothetical protein